MINVFLPGANELYKSNSMLAAIIFHDMNGKPVIFPLLYPLHSEVVVYWFYSVRPSLRPSTRPPIFRVRSLTPTVLVQILFQYAQIFIYFFLINSFWYISLKFEKPCNDFKLLLCIHI